MALAWPSESFGGDPGMETPGDSRRLPGAGGLQVLPEIPWGFLRRPSDFLGNSEGFLGSA